MIDAFNLPIAVSLADLDNLAVASLRARYAITLREIEEIPNEGYVTIYEQTKKERLLRDSQILYNALKYYGIEP